MAFDFEAAVTVPFRMQPGLRRIGAPARHFTPLAPGGRHQREKIAVLSAFADDALCAVPGFDPAAALHAAAARAAAEHPAHWHWDGHAAEALALGVAVDRAGRVEQRRAGAFGHGDEIARTLSALAPHWRLPGLLALAFAEDLAVVQAPDGRLPWLSVALPSHWAPAAKVGRTFADAHAPVADGAALRGAAAALVALVTDDTAETRWERFVWTVTDHPRLHAHPARTDPRRWHGTPASQGWWRTERQTFLPVQGARQALFTIAVDVQPLSQAIDTPDRAARLHDALASMSPAVLDYRGLAPVRDALLAWLSARARHSASGVAVRADAVSDAARTARGGVPQIPGAAAPGPVPGRDG